MSDDDDRVAGERRTAPAPARGPGRARPVDADLPEIGAVVDGKYRVERVLGSGGMGVVVAATHLVLHEPVALKFVKIGPGTDELVERLRREARIAFRIKSQHATRLLDVGTLPTGAPYLVMEYLDGRDLARELGARGALPIAEAVDDVLQACEAMAEAHGLGVVHRDLKPSNLFLTRGADNKPLVKVLDFGIAKAVEPEGSVADTLTGTGAMLGSPLYMSPEQVRGAREVDARSDVWSLGVIVHELVTGAPPFPPGPASAVCAAIAADEPEPLRARRPDAAEELETVVLRCLEKDPERRYPSVCALAEALAPFASPASAAVVERIASLADGPRGAAAVSAHASPASRAALENAITLSAWNARSPGPGRPARYAALALAVLGIGGAWAVARSDRSSGPSPTLPSAPRSPAGLASTPGEPPRDLHPAVTAPPAGPPATVPSTSAPPAVAPVASSAEPVPRVPASPRASRPAAPAPVALAATATASAASPPAPVVHDDLEERATSRRH